VREEDKEGEEEEKKKKRKNSCRTIKKGLVFPRNDESTKKRKK